MFGRLKEIMRVFKLNHVMRTTVEVNNLIKLTQSYLNNKANQYEGGQKIYSQIRYSLVFEENVPEQLLRDK